MTETFLPVISILSSCASPRWTFQTMPPSSVMFQRVCAETLKTNERNAAADKMRGNFIKTVCEKNLTAQALSVMEQLLVQETGFSSGFNLPSGRNGLRNASVKS